MYGNNGIGKEYYLAKLGQASVYFSDIFKTTSDYFERINYITKKSRDLTFPHSNSSSLSHRSRWSSPSCIRPRPYSSPTPKPLSSAEEERIFGPSLWSYSEEQLRRPHATRVHSRETWSATTVGESDSFTRVSKPPPAKRSKQEPSAATRQVPSTFDPFLRRADSEVSSEVRLIYRNPSLPPPPPPLVGQVPPQPPPIYSNPISTSAFGPNPISTSAFGPNPNSNTSSAFTPNPNPSPNPNPTHFHNPANPAPPSLESRVDCLTNRFNIALARVEALELDRYLAGDAHLLVSAVLDDPLYLPTLL